MAQWSANGSNNAGTPNWGHALVNKAANSTIRGALHNNTSANVFVDKQVVSIVSVDATEVAIHKEVTHTGHHKRTVGTGGRAGRVHYECLVAGGIVGDINADDNFLPDAQPAIVVDFEPQSGNSTTANLKVVSHVVPRTLVNNTTFQWQGLNSTPAFQNITANATNGANASNLNLTSANTYRVILTVNSTVNATSINAVVT